MPKGIHRKDVNIPIDNVWNFVSDMNNWAPLVPGYIEHKILNKKQSTWKFKGDTGIVQKTIKMRIDITKWQEPTKVTFDLKGLSDNFKGDGYFEAEALSGTSTKITGCLNISGKGMMGPMMNTVLKSLVPKTAKELTEAVAEKIQEEKAVMR